MTRRLYALAMVLFFALSAGKAQAQLIYTIAGYFTSGYSGDGGLATAAELFHPKGTVVDDTGNVYIADADNNVIRKVRPSGIITTYAGISAGGFSGDGGPCGSALMNRPNSVAIDRRGNMYICDADNQRIRKVNAAGIITTVVGDGTAGYLGDGGPATAAEINYPGAIAVDDTGNLYIADEYNNRIRKVDTFGVIRTFAGTGSTGYSGEGGNANAADIGFPFGIATDHFGNVYFSLTLGNRVCKVNAAHIITTAAGTGGGGGFSGDGGPATAADFDTPWGIGTDAAGNLYIADNANERIRKVTVWSGVVTTIAGTGSSGFSGDAGPATAAKLKDPAGVYADGAGNIYIADYNNHRIRKILTPFTHAPSFTGGHSQPMSACVNAIAVSADSLLHVSDADAGQWENWTIVTLPLHGTLSASYGTVSTGSVLIPSGTFYTPTTGYVGTDSFRVRVSDGTASDTTTIHVTVSSCSSLSAGVAAAEGNRLDIYPNPGSGTFTIRASFSGVQTVPVAITNMLGGQVETFNITANSATEITLHQPPGLYFVHAALPHSSWVGKLVIQ